MSASLKKRPVPRINLEKKKKEVNLSSEGCEGLRREYHQSTETKGGNNVCRRIHCVCVCVLGLNKDKHNVWL